MSSSTSGSWSWVRVSWSVTGVAVMQSARRDEERAKPKGEALDLPVNLCSNPHLWSWALGNDQQNEITGTRGWNEWRGPGLTMRDKVRSLDIWERLVPLLLHVERSQLRGSGHLAEMSTWHLLVEVFLHVHLGRDPGADPGIISLSWSGNTSGFPRMSSRKWPGKRTYGCPYSACCQCDPVPDNDE